MGQKFKINLAEQFWLSVSHEAAIRCRLEPQEHFQDDSPTWLSVWCCCWQETSVTVCIHFLELPHKFPQSG